MATDSATIDVPLTQIPSDNLYEVIDGRIVELPPMGAKQVLSASKLMGILCHFAATAELGLVVMEMLFDFSEQLGRNRRPDLAFVSFDRWPKSKEEPPGEAWRVVPNLAVEVISPSNGWDEIREKIKDYFKVGVERVWVISKEQCEFHVFDKPTNTDILTIDDTLTDETLLPGFRLKLREFFGV